jgi:uncharacterized protein
MKIAIAGYTGLLGRTFVRLNPDYVYIELDRNLLYGPISDLAAEISEADVILNLAGASIWRPWTGRNRKRIIRSREVVNRNLVIAIKELKGRRPMLVTASAIHIYSEKEGFLKEVAARWEAPLDELEKEMSSVILRMAVVLGNEGGALKVLRKIAKLGFTVVMGSGRQAFSFIHLEDWAKAVRFILDNRLEGIFDLAAPRPVDYATFTRKMKEATGAPFIIRIPVPLLKMTMGEAHTIVTDHQNVTPVRLTSHGFIFRFPDIDSVLNNLIK